ncbi:MAG TPA: type II CAAX endopeptidase family protein [Solirubrobacteraceae bacterium]|nr:type II CAAX endopeptidase family protein [Solirubrobacteraceae bacterium]
MEAPLIPPPAALPHNGAPLEQEPPTSGSAAWSPWLAPAALVGGIVLAAVGGLLVDIPALALGVDVTASHLPAGLSIADTAVQDAAFVIVAVFLAQLGGRKVSAALFGLRPTPLRRAVALMLLTVAVFVAFSVIWGAVFDVKEEKLLETLGANESTLLLVLSAALTCVIAPIGEEFLFRGFIFTALRNWRGAWTAAVITGALFGLVHIGSAPALDLVPLAALGVGLCLLYRATGSLYPCIAAHALNNSLAFGGLEHWSWTSVVLLMLASLTALVALALALTRAGVTSRVPAPAR